MTTELVLIVKATVILGLALVASRIARRTRASLRASILSAAFGLMLVMPIASAITPSREVQIPAAIAPAFFVDELAANPIELVEARPLAGAQESSAAWHLPSLRTLSRGVWLLGTMITVMPLALGLWRVRNIRRRGRAWPSGSAFADRLRASIGLHRAVTVILHNRVATPVTCGWVRPTIVMPIDAQGWSNEEVRQALLHELEHVRRHDWPVHVLARLTCALYWFHPAAWMAWRQLSLDSERACDDAVVSQAENTAYAQQLISLARRVSTGSAEPLLSMADRRTLATRVASILSTTVARGRVGFVPVAAIIVVALTLSAALFPLQARARVQSARDTAVDSSLRFGVASVRPNDGSDPSRGFGFTLESGRLRLRNQTLRTIVSVAYAPTFGLWFPDERISGGPSWMNSERFTIDARAERAVTGREMGAMLRTLLAERFGLKVRIESRTAPIYALVVVKRDRSLGPSLKRTANECTGRCGIGGGGGRYQLAGASMALLAGSLSELVGRPVVDRTDLSGTFDGTLEWAPTTEELGALGEPAPAAPVFGASLFTALEEQFGLKLESARGGVDYLVIDSAAHPTPNETPEREAGAQAVSAGPEPPQPEISFDIVSVRPNTGSDTSIPFGPIPPDGINLVNRPLESLVRQAYEVQFFRVINMPAWANQERFDITAKAGRPITDAERRLMLRKLLADRFGLTVHFEAREQPVYVMTRARSDGALGPGLKARPECPAAVDKCVSAGSAIIPAGRLSLKAATFDVLANGLMSAVLEGLVLNESKLDGHFDVELSWRPDSATADAADSRASFSTAVEEQLGMKLTAQRRPVQVLVIERIERPTPN